MWTRTVLIVVLEIVLLKKLTLGKINRQQKNEKLPSRQKVNGVRYIGPRCYNYDITVDIKEQDRLLPFTKVDTTQVCFPFPYSSLYFLNDYFKSFFFFIIIIIIIIIIIVSYCMVCVYVREDNPRA